MTAPDVTPPPPADLPTLECDLVMKGGITSGLVYPKAVVRVARDYRIRDIGGTSIGAIAAVLTAAAEYWRQQAGKHEHVQAQQERIRALMDGLPDDATEAGLTSYLDRQSKDLTGDTDHGKRGFAGLYQIPQEVGKDLMVKFQPQFWTAGLFNFATGLMGCSNPVSAVFFVLFRQFTYLRAILAAVFILVALTLRQNPSHGGIFLGIISLVAAALYAVFHLLSLWTSARSRAQGSVWRSLLPLLAFLGVLLLAALTCAVVPALPDVTDLVGWARTLIGEVIPDDEPWEVVTPLGVFLVGVVVIWRVAASPRIWGDTRAAWLVALPIATVVLASGTYAAMGGGFEWLQTHVRDIPAIRHLARDILLWVVTLLGLCLLRDIYLNMAPVTHKVPAPYQRLALNALIALVVLLTGVRALDANRETIRALLTNQYSRFLTTEGTAISLNGSPGDVISVLLVQARAAAERAHESAVRIETIETLNSASTLVAIIIGGLLGWSLAIFAAVLYHLLVSIPENYYGLCTGMGSGPGLERRKERALTNWLTRKIDEVAGIPAQPNGSETPQHHLTVGNLRGAKGCNPEPGETDECPGIRLEVITSDVDRGVPLKLPDALGKYWFRRDEFERFFPATVVALLTNADIVRPETCTIETAKQTTYEAELFPFASSNGDTAEALAHIPAVVIARMSMSFPVLFSAVPVYYRKGEQGPWKRHYLSDGGIVSNFPIHLFDRALAPRPTFAIDLVDRNAKAIPPSLNDQYSTSPIPRAGDPPRAATLVQDAAGGRLSGFLSDVINTARGWLDKSQATLPGYQERIVGIHLYKEQGEGGLNLDMDLDSINRLANRGMYGMHRFLLEWNTPGSGPGFQWSQHRWLRYLILMRSLENFGQEWARGYAWKNGPVHQPSIKDLVANNGPAGTPYAIPDSKLANAQALSAWFDTFAGDGRPTAGNGHQFGTPLPPGVFDSVEDLKEREPQLLMIPPFE